ncbi:MAG: hypothetical protein CEO12_356 [Parcubacteria group bacterium Gr01-1014_46]|nr:MAG: hypothetical protein CEO12_356 [Parcubacteria group bacterium Gr01-1014_46]
MQFKEENLPGRIPKKNIKFVVAFAVLLFASFLYLKNGGNEKVASRIPEISLGKTDEKYTVVYPKQYSDTHITENAKVTDEKYKDLSLSSKDNLLSNAISSLIRRSDMVASDNLLENGTWLWTPTLNITPQYRDLIILGARENSISTIYLSLDSYLDIFVMPSGEEKEMAKEKFNSIVRDFIRVANENKIAVDAEAGWQNWAQAGNSYKANVILDYVINFNKNNKEKFRGFQYDVEVYLLPEYFENREKVLNNFLNLISQTVTVLNNTDLEFSVVVPEFYDGTFDETPSFVYRGKRGYTIEHLLSILERRGGSKIIVMSYRNFSRGKDGSIDISRDEINLANKYNTKIVIAQETGDVPPPYITYYNTSRAQYDEEVGLIEKEFVGDKSFGGIATHYINAFLELK